MENTYDYIVVGGGSAGCVLANRLTQSGRSSVCLLEAGGIDSEFKIKIPAAFCKLFKTNIDWNYETEPQEHVNGRKMFWPRGKVLGGCSSINAMIYIRGNKRDYDSWAEAGCTGWSYNDVLVNFKQSEYQPRKPSSHHGSSGYLNVANLQEPNILSHTFVKACEEVGVPRNDDFNGPSHVGAGLYQVTQKDGARHSVANAYLEPALKRNNIQVVVQAQVTKILFEGKKAIGIDYANPYAQSDRKTVFAKKEIILCGGAINSPQLLMLSGIGPEKHLTGLGIQCRHDSPGVGQNLQDHLVAPIAYACTQPVSIGKSDNLYNLARFVLTRRGPFTSNVAEAGAFVSMANRSDVPDFQIHFGPAIFLRHGTVAPKEHGFSVGPTLIYPKSRGELTLRSNNPFDPPAIDPRYFSDKSDLDLMVEAFRFCRTIVDTKAFTPFRGKELYPGPHVVDKPDIEAHIREWVETIYHPVGTCKMGTDPMAVVDPRLRVHGIEGLRVADASIMPSIVGGNTNAPAIMIGEKASEMIRQDAQDFG
jgi:choline dehydrogenase